MDSVEEMSLCAVYCVKRVDDRRVAKTPTILELLPSTHVNGDDKDRV